MACMVRPAPTGMHWVRDVHTGKHHNLNAAECSKYSVQDVKETLLSVLQRLNQNMSTAMTSGKADERHGSKKEAQLCADRLKNVNPSCSY